MKAAIRRQLDYMQRNPDTIDAQIASGAELSGLTQHWWHKRLVISVLHRQQRILLYAKTRSMPDRFVNLVQRQVRPIVRGKARGPFEFGALARRASACGRFVSPCGMALPSCTGSVGMHSMKLRT